MASNNNIELVVTLENGQFKAATRETQNAINGIGTASTKSAQTASGSFLKLGTVIKGFMGLQAAKFLLDIGKAAIKGAADLEKNKVAFETLLGSAQKATKLLKDIQTMAAKTPLETADIVEASKRLIAFGESEETVIATMTKLGDAAMGNAEIFDRLTLAYGKTQAKQKATMEELNMFTEAGVPIVQALADKYGVSTAALMKMVEQGKVGFKDVNDALTNLTTGTGQFAGMMEKQAQTLSGMLSTMSDSFAMALTELGGAVSEPLKNIVGFLTEAVDSLTGLLKSIREEKEAAQRMADIKWENAKTRVDEKGRTIEYLEEFDGDSVTITERLAPNRSSAKKPAKKAIPRGLSLGGGGGEKKAAPAMPLVGGGYDIISAVDAVQKGHAAIEAAQAQHIDKMGQYYAAQVAAYNAMATSIMNKGLEVAQALASYEQQKTEQDAQALDARYSYASMYLEKTEKDETKRKEKQKKLDLIQAISKYMLQRKEFENAKSIQYAMASINMASGIVGAFALGIAQLGPIAGAIVGAIEAAAVAAVGGIQLSTIAASKPPMFVPSYDVGIFDIPKTTPATVHAGETVLTKPITDSIKNNEITLSGPGGGARVIQLVVDGKTLASVVDNERNKTAYSTNSSNYSSRGVY